MNKVVLMGRLTKDPVLRYSNQGPEQMAIANFTLAVDRKQRNQDGAHLADFIPCTAFGKAGEFAEKYFRQGLRVLVSGRIQTGSYKNRDGQKVYTTTVIVEEQEFADGKRDAGAAGRQQQRAGGQPGSSGYRDAGGAYHDGYGQRDMQADQGFMDVPDNADDMGLPFN